MSIYAYATITLYGLTFQKVQLKDGFFGAVLQPSSGTPLKFRLFPVRSPLLGESLVYFLFLLLLRCFSSEGWLLFRDNTPSVYWVVPFGNLRM